MGFFNEDMIPMLGVFQAETSELMATLDSIASRVEQERVFSPDDVAELFRCTHTTKGSSAMMGLDSLSTLTHQMEDLFDLMRNDAEISEGHVDDILDRLYAYSDFMKDELKHLSDDDYAPSNAENLIGYIAAYVTALSENNRMNEVNEALEARQSSKSIGGSSAEVEPKPTKTNDDASEENIEEPFAEAEGAALMVSFKPDVPMVNARALVILRQLGEQVDVKSYMPNDLTKEDTAQVIAENGLIIVVDPEDIETAKRFLAKSSFISRVRELDEFSQTQTKPTNTSKTGEAALGEDTFISLRWSSLRNLQDMAGEFLLHTAHLKALCTSNPNEAELRSAVSKTSRLVDDLVYQIDRMAMVRMSALVPQLSRMVRDMCRTTGKQVSFEVHGGNIEIDRNLYNSISEPLLHIIRNAVDHGIETPEERLTAGKEARGKVTLSIENLGARVAFRVSDDGRGVDTDKVLAQAEKKGLLEKSASEYTRQEILNMVLLAGLSTTDKVTQYSGRGVGMDVVNTVIRNFNGRVVIDSKPAEGTSITLFMPITVASVESLGFHIGTITYHLPLFNLNKVFTADEAAELISHFEGTSLFTYEKRQIPVLDMHKLLNCRGVDRFFIVCHSLDEEFVIGVDDIIGDINCANRPLPSCLNDSWQAVCPIRNVAIMDNGSIGYALNAALLSALAFGREDSFWQENASEDLGGNNLSERETSTDLPEWAFLFKLGQDCYGVSIDQVCRIIPLSSYMETPKGLPYLLGLTNYHNQAVALFDLAASAGEEEGSHYAFVTENNRAEFEAFTVSSAIGVRNLGDAVLAETQPEPRSFASGWQTSTSFVDDPKEPPITLLVRH